MQSIVEMLKGSSLGIVLRHRVAGPNMGDGSIRVVVFWVMVKCREVSTARRF